MVSFFEALHLASQIYALPAEIIYVVFLVILFKKRDKVYNSVFYDYIRLLGIVVSEFLRGGKSFLESPSTGFSNSEHRCGAFAVRVETRDVNDSRKNY